MPDATNLSRKILFVESQGLSFFRDHTVQRPLDSRLVGRWRLRVDRSTTPATATATYDRCTLRDDGRYEFRSSGEDPNGAVAGQWKVEDQILYIRRRGTMRWLPVGRYAVSGARLILLPLGGGKQQVWDRH